MIRTTLSCCALFGCLLGITCAVRQHDSDSLRRVEQPPQLAPTPSPAGDAATDAARDRQGTIARVSAEMPLARERGNPSLALNQPIEVTEQPAAIIDAGEAGASSDQGDAERLFELLLDDTRDLVQYRLSDANSRRAAPTNPAAGSAESLAGEPAANVLDGAADSADLSAEDHANAGSREANQEQSLEEDPDGTPPAGPPLDAEMLALRDEVRSCLSYYFNRPENASTRSPWGVMHSFIAFGAETQLIVNGRRVNAIGWLCWNQPCRGQRLFSLRNGRLQTAHGPGVQGHEGQFLCMLAQSRVRADYELRVEGKRLTIADLIELEKRTCRPNSELTFKLIGLVHYLPSDATWTCDGGETWNIPRMIQEELDQPVVGAACGGTHRMMGFSYAVRKREQRGEPLEGQWLRAKKYVDAYHEYTFKLQNPDGSFSTDWFRSRASSPDIQRRVQTTGHILEWLVYSLPRERLSDPRVLHAVRYLSRLMTEHRQWEIGPQGHALHALVLFDRRMFGGAESLASRLRTYGDGSRGESRSAATSGRAVDASGRAVDASGRDTRRRDNVQLQSEREANPWRSGLLRRRDR